MAKGPQLTQRKIDKLRDALRVVAECDQIPPTGVAADMLGAALILCGELELGLRKKL